MDYNVEFLINNITSLDAAIKRNVNTIESIEALKNETANMMELRTSMREELYCNYGIRM